MQSAVPSTSPLEMVSARNLRKTFAGKIAVRDVSITASAGQVMGLLGPNGAGKTTTIHMLLGLITPDLGQVEILGLPLNTERLRILERVNFSSAYVTLPGNLNVYETLNVFARLYGVTNPRARIKEALELVEFHEDPKKLIGILSAGQRTRLNLCKALLNRPEVLFLDEPTASLDPEVALKVRKTLRRIQSEHHTTIIYTSHNMHEVEEVCDHVVFLSRGTVVATGSPEEIITRSKSSSLEEVFITIARDGELKDADSFKEDL